MSRDSRFDILFEPVKIGPVTARNRFYQVPHCSGMGYRYPNAEAHLRGMKAEGGWAVVSTQEAEIHPTSDLTPANEARLWDDGDLPALSAVTERIHAHGSLAAIQLVHNGLHVANRFSRMIPLAPSHAVSDSLDPVQARAMDKADITDMRRWYRNAALRAKKAGFDIVYLYAGHDMSVLQHFLSRRHNDRSDEYGGSFENRLRLFREILDDVREAIGDTCALAVRLAVDELMGPSGITCEGEGKDIISALGELPDLWDVNLSDWSNDSQTARFSEEGYQEPYIRFVKSVTTKPVVGVGRYTSPDSMVRVVKQGILDFIGAARPSIADPFLPKKIEEGRIDDIRECIGCNICTSGDNTNVPMRCTQNPTVGEEWRKGWHPETIARSEAPEPALIIGGGPAGLEAARALAQRGVDVMLAEGGGEWGGRVARECRLPGLATWGRVRDWRIGQLSTRVNAELYLHSPLSAADILQYGIPHVAIATGASWRTDGVGRTHRMALDFLSEGILVSPDAILSEGAEAVPSDGPVVVFDDDCFYMGSVLAELLARRGRTVTFVTPESQVSPWSRNTLEQARIQKRLIGLGVEIVTAMALAGRTKDQLELSCVYSGRSRPVDCATLVPVTARLPDETLWLELKAREAEWADAGIKTITRLGDCLAPGLIAAAVYSGHQYARTYQEQVDKDRVPFMREDIARLYGLRSG
ncbi:oxidoreductase [Sinorhizobium meliloti]|uniref:Oxidoreductase n=1 Tax=Sinorhizobium meliloti (strain SM11) TaxID=707241 RepID=F7XCG9_SINMM|nr:NAD(P)-binding protein [Sinorhizobium meliloti]AEH82675.1 oxidoreductase [Sinorhizobium meliloti SM11]ARS67469.1 NADH:flavin oxidoreductase [Sinorhizobium meliloti RU11/001]ASP67438.1 NADH:flavin oxidoreductase [Sinorhizobium meliloti]ASP80671.1 NADH:flavin oxidoreductase [Sinorhizobium meliloti]MBP2470419.1 dimethylamine/trimethylamine dehydrogenase [Sinorhizobium meliloti]